LVGSNMQPDMTPNGMMLNVTVSPNIKIKK
jgi:hypothetical protein